jgi:TorA maturation chaperone TorD
VERWYHRAGLLIAPGHPRVPDHAALELQFMQHLCDRETGALARGAHQTARAWRAIQHAFLRHHLWVWFPQFCQRLQQPTVHRFYRCLAQLALALLEADLSDPQLASQNPPATTEAERQGGAS